MPGKIGKLGIELLVEPLDAHRLAERPGKELVEPATVANRLTGGLIITAR